MLAGLKALNETVTGLVADEEERKRTDEEKLAIKAAPRAATVLSQTRPTDSKDNVVSEEGAKETVRDGEDPPSSAKLHVGDLLRSAGVGMQPVPTAAPAAPVAPPAPAAPPNGE